MQRHVSAYDLFAILVPGATALGLFVASIAIAADLPSLPPSLQYPGVLLAALLLLYLVGHCLEGANSLLSTKWWSAWATYVWHGSGERMYASQKILDPTATNNELGPQFIAALFASVNRLFHTSYDSANERDRFTAFMLCSAFLEQHGEAERGVKMQTLHRLCVSLQSVLRWGGWLLVLGLPLLVVADTQLTWISWGLHNPSAQVIGQAVALGLFCALLAFRFREKATKYDDYFVLNVVRGFAAQVARTT